MGFDTVGEAIAFLRQVFERLRYLHKQNVAHRDITSFNIAMDGSQLYSEPFHPAEPTMKRDWSGHISHKTRTQVPVKYYLIDFGLSRRFSPEDFPVRVPGAGGGYYELVPEYKMQNDELPPPSDPFLVDVYCMGNLIRMDFTEGSIVASRKLGFKFLEPLVAEMTNENPSERPNMDQVIDRFEHLVRGLSPRKLRSRVVKEKDHLGFFRAIPHWIRKVRFVVGKYPTIPMP